MGHYSDGVSGARARRWFLGAVVVYAATLTATWTPFPGKGRGGINVIPFVEQARGINAWLRGKGSPWALVDLGVNVVLLVPFTVALARGCQVTRGPRRFAGPTALLGCGASVLIEVGQLFIRSRATDVTDLILNSAGVLLTVQFMTRRARRSSNPPATADARRVR